MKIWIVFVGETLPMDNNFRYWRYTMLVDELIKRGHEVIRYAPSFNHSSKKQRCEKDTQYEFDKRYVIKLIKTTEYRQNIGFARLISYKIFSLRVLNKMKSETDKPDVIITSIPSPIVFRSVMSFAKEKHIPVILDVRDIWPDVFFMGLGYRLKKILKNMYSHFIYNICLDIKSTSAITGVSKEYVDWAMTCVNSNAKPHMVFPIGYKPVVITKSENESIKKDLNKANINENDFICTFIGQLTSTYDIETIVSVSNKFKGSDVKIVICGDGKKRTIIEKQLSNNSNLIYLGWVSQKKISVLLSMSNVGLVSYSKNASQSLPNKPFEYMAYSLPLVSSLRGELDAIIDKNGIGLKYLAGSVDELYSAINLLIGSKSIENEMRRKSYDAFIKYYYSGSIYSKMSDFIESI